MELELENDLIYKLWVNIEKLDFNYLFTTENDVPDAFVNAQ